MIFLSRSPTRRIFPFYFYRARRARKIALMKPGIHYTFSMFIMSTDEPLSIRKNARPRLIQVADTICVTRFTFALRPLY